MHNFGLCKVSPIKQLLLQQVGFVNLRHFFQHRSRAKHWFNNLKILIGSLLFLFLIIPWMEQLSHCRFYRTSILKIVGFLINVGRQQKVRGETNKCRAYSPSKNINIFLPPLFFKENLLSSIHKYLQFPLMCVLKFASRQQLKTFQK